MNPPSRCGGPGLDDEPVHQRGQRGGGLRRVDDPRRPAHRDLEDGQRGRVVAPLRVQPDGQPLPGPRGKILSLSKWTFTRIVLWIFSGIFQWNFVVVILVCYFAPRAPARAALPPAPPRRRARRRRPRPRWAPPPAPIKTTIIIMITIIIIIIIIMRMIMMITITRRIMLIY